jgi:MFS family permease
MPITVVATWFKRKKGLAIGIVASGASISGLIYPYMFRTLLGEYGFNLAVRYVAIVITCTSGLAILCAVPNPHHPKNHAPENLRAWFTLRLYLDTSAFKEPAYAFFVAAICFMFFGFYPIFFNLEEWAVSEGFGFRALANVGANAGLPSKPAADQIHTYWLLAIMNGSSTLGRIGSAYLCDKLGALIVHGSVMLIASLLVLILWSLSHTLMAAIGFVVVFGIFSGAVIGLPPASVAYILGPDPQRQKKLGQWTGMMYCCSAIFALCGPIIAGHMISEFNTFLTVQLWSGACLFLSSLCIFSALYCRNKAVNAAKTQLSRFTSRSVSETDLEKDKDAEEV